MILYTQQFITLEKWEELSQAPLQSIQNPNGLIFENKFDEENTNQKIITLTKRLTLFEQIGAFFKLLSQQLFSRDPHIRAILPKAWKAFIAGKCVQSYIYQEASYWDSLPHEISNVITTYLNPSDLATLSQANTKFGELKAGWESVAERIQCPLDPQLPPKQQVQAFTSELKKKSKILQNLLYTAPLIKSNKVDDLCTLQKLIKARDTAVVWEALAKRIDRPGDAPNQDTFNKIESLLEIPEQFTAWCKMHQTRLNQLTALGLTSNQLTTLPREIWNLTQLKDLYLNDNQLTSLPPEIGNLTRLEFLLLPDNQLTSLPPEIRSLAQLIDLDLRNNQLTSLPPEIGNLIQLKFLNLTYNQLTSLPPEIGNLTQVKSIFLRGNKLTSLPKEINQLQRTVKISLKTRISLWFNSIMSRLSALFERFITHLNEFQKKIRGDR